MWGPALAVLLFATGCLDGRAGTDPWTAQPHNPGTPTAEPATATTATSAATPGSVVVVDGVGKSFLAARAMWLRQKLTVAAPVIPGGDGSDPPDSVLVVLSQDPPAGSLVAPGTEVTVTAMRLDRPPPTTSTTWP